MRILIPHGFNTKKWHIDAGVDPNDPNLRITKCSTRYFYGGSAEPQVIQHSSCIECIAEELLEKDWGDDWDSLPDV